MNAVTISGTVIHESSVRRDYGTTVLKAARHRHWVSRDAGVLDLADELGKRPDIELVTVLDEAMRPVGLIVREALFALLGKPFGREVLGKGRAAELAEPVPTLDAHESLFYARDGDGEGSPYRALVDGDGRFRAALAMRDLAERLSRITEEDIELAGRVQERLEAANEPVGGDGYAFEAWSRPARGVGGDFWYSSRLADGSVFMALCDVSGKGVAASLVVSLVWGMLRMYDFRRGLGALVVALNDAIVTTFHLEKYLTGFFCVFSPSSGTIEAADMGHSHALLVRGGKALAIRSGDRNLPVGVEPSLSPALRRWRLRPGDTLVVYSDGIPEQEDDRGAEFGERGLAAAAVEAVAERRSLRDTLPALLDDHRGRVPQQDDMSFMMLRLSGA